MKSEKLIELYGRRSTPLVRILALILLILFGILLLVNQTETPGRRGESYIEQVLDPKTSITSDHLINTASFLRL